MPNPNELQRLEEERIELIKALTDSGALTPKGKKEEWLRELRAIEKLLGIQGQPYNSTAFGGDYGGNGR